MKDQNHMQGMESMQMDGSAESLEHMQQMHGTSDVPMSHSFSPNLPMNRNGSGTGWLPDASPMYGYMAHTRKWMYMFHGNVFVRYNKQDLTDIGTRGDSKIDAPNWVMAMGQRKVGNRGLFRFSTMFSLDPLFGGDGYPLLFQTGETYQGKPLVDRQHPHNLFSGLSVAYTQSLNEDIDAFVYLAYPGEPALGPVAFMHRPSAQNTLDSPLGHHWQDATHITGIATVYWRDFSGSSSFLFKIRLVLLGTLVAQCAMPSFSVVPALNVFKNSQSGLLLSWIIFMVYQLCFQRFKEAFGYCIIPADPKSGLGLRSIPFSAHTLQHRQAF